MTKTHSTDVVMRKLLLHLVGDFRNTFGHDLCRDPIQIFKDHGIKALREYTWPTRSQVSPPLFKALYQVENLFKRYRFEDDLHTDDELEQMALEKFEATQTRVARPFHVGPIEHRVLRRARSIISRILGDYSEEEHMTSCRFGKRACLGTPFVDSYLDHKLVHSPLTGSAEHYVFFRKCLDADPILKRTMGLVTEPGTRFRLKKAVRIALVPKSYKSLRSMMPDTFLGAFYTAGLGKMIQARLMKVGLDIRKLQQLHRRIVKRASLDRKLVTADLSSASDSITLQLLRWLLPVKWYRALVYGRARYAEYGTGKKRRRIYLTSTVTMGLGHTFPLQTLVFYGLLTAIGELVGIDGQVSVYGDDLIYSRSIHKFVKRVFPALHLNLNGDKTYAKDFFRESCGSDHYRGVDVRPFQPEGSHQRISGSSYAQFLYRTYNGLKLRWDECEIPQTLDFLESELILHVGEIYQVPCSFPDTSGIKTDRIVDKYFYCRPVYRESSCAWVFKYLRDVADNRPIDWLSPYYWDKLRVESGLPKMTVLQRLKYLEFEREHSRKHGYDLSDTPELVRRVKPPKPIYRKSDVAGWHKVTIPSVATKGQTHCLVQEARSSTWT